jgi:hypothetical protein
VVRGAAPPVIKCIQCFSFIPVWNTSCGMGGIPPSNNTVTVILLCAVSFLLNHDPDLRIFSLRTSGPTTAGFPVFAMTSTQQPSNVWRRHATRRSSCTCLARPRDGSGVGVALALPSRPPPPPPEPPPRPRRRPRRRWGFRVDAGAAASPAPGAAPGGAGASTPAKDTAPVPSDDEGGAELISPERGDSDQASSP